MGSSSSCMRSSSPSTGAAALGVGKRKLCGVDDEGPAASDVGVSAVANGEAFDDGMR